MKKPLYILFFLSINAFSQKVEFNDPDLTFSFVKPTDWKVQDDLVVKIIPNSQSFESATTFFSITYFEAPEKPAETASQLFDSGEIQPAIPSGLKEFKTGETGRVYIADETALWTSYYHTLNDVKIKAFSYVFLKLDQRFEITISSPTASSDLDKKELQEIISSIKIRNK